MEPNQEIIFVTGKGGVGKSAVAAATAWARAQQGKRTLLVELGHQSFFKDYFGLERVSYKPTQLRDKLDVALWSGPESLKEYALHLIKIEALYKLFFENQVSHALMSIAPALSELAILGKITSAYRRVGPELPYDCIVVDAYATGHMMALLRAPKGMAEAVKYGPMGDQSREIFAVIRDPAKTKFFVVSFPEELPVVEAIELADGINEIIGHQPTHILNRYLGIPIGIERSAEENSFANYIAMTNERQQWALKQLISHHGDNVKILPYTLKVGSWDVVDSLAKEFLNA